jgi:hypothetical protein
VSSAVTQSLAEDHRARAKAGAAPRVSRLHEPERDGLSTFTRHKTPAFVNLDFNVTFTPHLCSKDLDLGPRGPGFRRSDALASSRAISSRR